MSKRILFLTGTRADFGKLKPLMHAVETSPDFECFIFATGMHTLARYGLTVDEIYKTGFSNIHVYMNQIHGESMDLILANTVSGLSRYVREYRPDMIVVHGDRIEALAGAIVGAVNNILVFHIEGGEVSGTIDETIRHAVSKLSHLHFTANQEAAERLIQMGEIPESVFVGGSPDIEAMLSPNLPTLEEVKSRYGIEFLKYAIVLFHPVTTEEEDMLRQAYELTNAIIASGLNYVVIYPNNDTGSNYIFQAYKQLENNTRYKMFPSIRFEYFLTLLKNSSFIIGNSSVGIREAPVYAVPSVNIGSRQHNRFNYMSIINTKCDSLEIQKAITMVQSMNQIQKCYYFGDGNSSGKFMEVLRGANLWETPKQKHFCDMVLK